MFLGVFSLQACEGRQAATMEISAAYFQVFRNSLLAGGSHFLYEMHICLAHHCQFCPEFTGMGTGVEGGLVLYPIPFIFSITRKKNIITFCPVLKKDLDNLSFLGFFF